MPYCLQFSLGEGTDQVPAKVSLLLINDVPSDQENFYVFLMSAHLWVPFCPSNRKRFCYEVPSLPTLLDNAPQDALSSTKNGMQFCISTYFYM